MGFDFVEKVMCVGSGSTSPTFQFYKRGFNLGGSIPSWQDIVLSGNGSLSLTAALANGLNYLKLFGGTEQRNLPSWYTQVEYLESDGTQYIDTGIVLNSKATITTVGQFMSDTTPNPITIWGFMGNSNMPRWGCSVYTNRWLMDLNSTTNSSDANTNKHTFVNETNGTTTYNSYVDGVSIYSNPMGIANPTSYISNVLSAYIFARNNSNTAGNFSSSRIYSFNIVQDDIEVINLIPARRNSDNVLGMFDLVSQTFLTNSGTGTFTAGADITAPSPDNPIDIVCNNGVVKVSKNLFDKDTINTVLGSIDGNGNFSSATNRARSEYIPVVASQTYTLSIDNSNIQVVPYYYNSSKAFLSYDTGWKTQPFTFTVPNNCSYLCILYKDVSTEALQLSSIKDIQLEKGSTATPYTPYSTTGYYTDGITETVEITGKNLFDVNSVDIQLSTAISADGSLVPNSSVNTCMSFISVKPNTTYTISGDVLGTEASFFRLAQYKADKTFISRSEDSTGQRSSYTFTTSANTYYIRFHYRNSANLNTYQLEQGSTATAYEPYTVLGTATAENLFKIGDYKDVQEVLTGNVTRNIGVKVLDGTEDWKFSSGDNAFYINGFGQISGLVYCTHFKGAPILTADLQIRAGGGWGLLVRYNALNGSVSNFKQYLADQYNAGTPVIVLYPLATATTETVTAQSLTTQAGNNTISIVQASIDDLGLEVSYKATV